MKTRISKGQNRSGTSDVVSVEHRVMSSGDDASVYINIRERKPAKRPEKPLVPLLLVHGATIASILWDNPLPGWSWMDRLAQDGFHVFAVDLRGYGQSSRPASFDRPPLENRPYAKATEVVQDVLDAINFIKARTGYDQIDLLGGSWGSIICGKLIAEKPNIGVRRLVLYAPLFCEPDSKPSWLPEVGGSQANTRPMGAYREVSIKGLKDRWDAEIPVADKTLWRAPGVFEALADSCIGDSAGYTWSTPDTFRAPGGTIADLFEIYSGKPLYDCSNITIPTLLVRGAADPVSTHGDAARLFEQLNSSIKHYTIVGEGAHFMIGEKSFLQVHQIINSFLSAEL